jgi:DNA helicase HerA-like ATPase
MKIGTLLSGSLVDGFFIRINPETQLEEIKSGKFVSIIGKHYTFFSLITDLKLDVSHPDVLLYPPTQDEPILQEIIQEKNMYATAVLRPMLMLDKQHRPQPVKTIPPHFAHVYEAREDDIARIFGKENAEHNRYFNIGTPLDMKTPVCIDLDKITERSNGIFGKTGTGKTFLTRLVLAGLIKSNKASTIIFDMHSEYGLQSRKEGEHQSFVKGLKSLFGQKVAIFSLDPESTRRRGGAPDAYLTLSYQSIRVNDIISLQHELNLHPTACEAAYLLEAKYKKNWLSELLAPGNTMKDLAEEVGAHAESISALHRKLRRIERLAFFQTQPQQHDIINQMMEYIDNGMSIIIEFGNYTSTFCYLLIANIISRRIHSLYIEKTERFLASQKKEDEPKKLMITIEEAHKFLNPQTARQTIFGTIAREMRKYYVSLLVIDQRPSGIEPEILSQIGTKIIAQLSDDKDISAVFSGTSNATQLRSVLATLDSKKQVLLLGHAITMPVVIETRAYDETFYRDMQPSLETKHIDELSDELF